MQYRLWQVVSAIVQRMPLRASYAVATVIGVAAFYGWPRGRRALARNYGHVLREASPAERRRVARRSLVNYCKYLADFARFPALSAEDLRARVKGEETWRSLDGALARGRGAIMVCTHFGNWDLGAGAAAARGYSVAVVAETFADARLDGMVVASRRRLGVRVLKMERAAPSIVRTLRNNGLLALLIDRPMAGDGVRVRFFGEEVEVPAGPARLALATGAAVVPAALPRIDQNGPEVATLADFTVTAVRTGDSEADVRALTQQIMDAHERFIRRYPDQWYMFREMWPAPRAGKG
ncbi:MAG: lysophospholipid acyltransferase family protein [Tepidiformaceae bacterium]